MLVLGRTVGQSILIGKDITITVVSNRPGQIRLGVEAPQDVKILREELEDCSNKGKKRAKKRLNWLI